MKIKGTNIILGGIAIWALMQKQQRPNEAQPTPLPPRPGSTLEDGGINPPIFDGEIPSRGRLSFRV